MKLHGNARTCLHSRLLIVERVLEQGWTVAAAAAAGLSERTAAKWLARYRDERREGWSIALRRRIGSLVALPLSVCG